MPSPTTAELIAANVRRIRADRGFSQQELAQRMGVAQSRVSEIEHGRGGVQSSTIDKLSDALACRPSDLLSQQKAQAVPA